MPIADPASSLENLKSERDATWLYERLASFERDRDRAELFRAIAAAERRHAGVWAEALEQAGLTVPAPSGPRLRVRVVVALARVLGSTAVADLVRALERDEESLYQREGTPEEAAIAADERVHAEVWRRIGEGGAPAAPATGAELTIPVTLPAEREKTIADRWHEAGRSGTFRASVFGVSDGLVSNLALVMGVAGAAESVSADGRFVLLAGIAGLLAGAFSMAAGEYISMQSQRELYERQIALERAELAAMPEDTQAELTQLYRSKGFTEDEASAIAERICRDPDLALETVVREQLGLDPGQLGSPWGAAVGSFLAFCAGAIVPVIPYFFGAGAIPFWSSLGISLVALFAVGAGVSLLTGRSTLYSGARQTGVGLGAALVTYVVGRVIGVGVAG